MIRVLLTLVLTLSATAASADTLVLQAAEAAKVSAQARPETGLTMSTVRTRFGQPQQVMPAVGDPPITRWLYSDYTVYFEHDRVINTVPRR